jgi:hypothetical protein
VLLKTGLKIFAGADNASQPGSKALVGPNILPYALLLSKGWLKYRKKPVSYHDRVRGLKRVCCQRCKSRQEVGDLAVGTQTWKILSADRWWLVGVGTASEQKKERALQ